MTLGKQRTEMHPDHSDILDSVNHTCSFLGKRHVTFGKNSPTPLLIAGPGAQDPATSCQIIDVIIRMYMYIYICVYDSLGGMQIA